MKSLHFCGLALALAGAAQGAKPAGCSDVPISMTFVATSAAPATIWNDLPNSAYVNGVSGVGAVIHYNNDCNGTRDATLTLFRSKRALVMQYGDPIPGSIIVSGPPAFAGGPAFSTQAHVNVHNLLGRTVLTPGVAATFYTKVGSTFPAPDGSTFRLRFLPDDFACPLGATCVPNLEGDNTPNINQPAETAWALVTYTPRDPTKPYSGTNADHWIVDGELSTSTDTTIERATLFLEDRHAGLVHQGQYSMPFKILITALGPLQ